MIPKGSLLSLPTTVLIPPTSKHVEVPHVVVMKFENGKVASNESPGN
jgi:hypothetical protein